MTKVWESDLKLPLGGRTDPFLLGVQAAPAAHGAHRPAAGSLGSETPAGTQRLVSIDAYRGLVMVLMLSAGLGFGGVVRAFAKTPGWEDRKAPFWDVLAYQTDHPPWAAPYPAAAWSSDGWSKTLLPSFADNRAWGTLWDQIQPSFMFLVGTALAFSLASRRAKGQSFGRMLWHALVRSALLVGLGVLLASNWSSKTNWSFTGVLGQIGLGYPFLFLLAWLRPRWQWLAAGVLLVAYWGAFAAYRVPPAGADLTPYELKSDWPRLEGFASHWEKNVNVAARADQWFLNLFPQANGKPFTFEGGGYQTLNFVPSLATMIFGLLAGELIRSSLSAGRKVGTLVGLGLLGIGVGWALAYLGVCPLVKRIWTPSWAVYSAGWAALVLGLFYLVVDVGRLRRWTYPLVVVGANSIAIYCVSMMLKPWVRGTMRRHLGQDIYELPGRGYGYVRYQLLSATPPTAETLKVLGQLYAPIAEATVFLLFCWLICWWMYRNRVFIKI